MKNALKNPSRLSTFRDQRGFSLAETVGAVATWSVTMLVACAALALSAEGLRSIEQLLEIEGRQADVRLAVGNNLTCTNNLKNLTVQPNGAATTVPLLNQFDSAGNQVGQILPGVQHNGVTLQSLSISQVSSLDSSTILASLQATYRRSSALGGQILVRSIPVSVSMNGTSVVGCSTDSASPTVTQQKFCGFIAGQAGQTGGYYDPTTGTCKVTVTNWVSGTSPFSAQCPSTQVTAQNGDQNSNCQSVPPAGFVDDPSFLVSVTYSDGSVGTWGPQPTIFSLDATNNICTCIYANNVDPTGWQCQILCE
jgi:hypothetical protein